MGQRCKAWKETTNVVVNCGGGGGCGWIEHFPKKGVIYKPAPSKSAKTHACAHQKPNIPQPRSKPRRTSSGPAKSPSMTLRSPFSFTSFLNKKSGPTRPSPSHEVNGAGLCRKCDSLQRLSFLSTFLSLSNRQHCRWSCCNLLSSARHRKESLHTLSEAKASKGPAFCEQQVGVAFLRYIGPQPSLPFLFCCTPKNAWSICKIFEDGHIFAGKRSRHGQQGEHRLTELHSVCAQSFVDKQYWSLRRTYLPFSALFLSHFLYSVLIVCGYVIFLELGC